VTAGEARVQIKLQVDDRLKARLTMYSAKYALSQNGAVRELLHRGLDAAGVPDPPDEPS